ncbi:DUF3822 family protein [Daejeonella sp.]|uniref:DUF3822 family protein n=1 Tax=Daejeonella sp. TaxID=2805397 RepID=UPI0030C48CE9
MNKLLYLSDDEVQSQLATKYNLLVHIGLETFRYAIIDTVHDQGKVLAEFEIPKVSNVAALIKAIEDLPESSRQFKFSFNNVKISFDTSNYTFIPSDLYDEENREEYGKYLGLTGSSELLVHSLPSAEIKNIVAIESELNKALNRIFHKPRIYNQAAPFLEGVQRSLKREEDAVCFIDVQLRHFQVALFKDFKLEFYNSFEYANADEFNYYLLNIIESLNINLEQTPITLSGQITKTDEVYQRIEKYFESIRFMDSDQLIKYSDKFEEVLPHTFFTLFSLDLCV